MSDRCEGSVAGSDAAPPPEATPEMPTPAAKRPKPPQEQIDEFWAKFTAKTPSKATTVIPKNSYTDIVAKKSKKPSATTAQASYEEAAAMCRAKVEKIIKECRRINKKYRDPHFDIEADLKLGIRDCLLSLSNAKDADEEVTGRGSCPQSVKRVGDIFDDPKFYIDGPTTNDVRQGRNGDCWLMAALCTLSNKQGLIEKLCVAHDQACGVYGFVFHRDGEWISEIVDDFLYLIKPDYDESFFDRILFEDVDHINPEEAYRKLYQSNSGSLYYAQCENPQETWLPLLEKAYAKAHGDYAAIEGGYGGEGLEDLTGGVTSEVWSSDILDKEYFWKEELLKVNEEFLFGCSTGIWGPVWGERKGIIELHAYSIQKAVEVDGLRLLKLKNPWGKGEWKGPWSDGSKEWTPEWLTKLDHRFGDDGDFWISYDDLLRKYQAFERTRLFGPEWRIAQTWTTLNVPWRLDYHDTHFHFSIAKPGPVVIVLSQLDDRYFRGLQGQYYLQLSFRVHKAGHKDYIVRSQPPLRMNRSANVDLELEEGEYEVRVKINAYRLENILPIEEVIRRNAKDRRSKLQRIGLAYDLAHSKGRVDETPEEKASREAHEKKEKNKKRAEIKKKILKDREQAHYLRMKQFQRDLKTRDHKREKKAKKLAEKKVKQEAKKEAKKTEKAKKKAEKKAKKEAETKGEAEVKEEPKDEDETEVKKEPEAEEGIVIKEEPKDVDIQAIPEAKEEAKKAASTDSEEAPVVVAKPGDDNDSAEPKPEAEVETKEAPESDEKEANEEEWETDEEEDEEDGKVKKEVAEGDKEDKEEEEEEDSSSDSSDSSSDSSSDEEEEEDDDISTVGSLSDISDREVEIQIDAHIPPEEEPAPPAEEEPDEFELDPWNAVAVVGLRVYYKLTSDEKPEDVIKLKVVRPDPYIEDDEEEDEDKDKDKKDEEDKECLTQGLDVDDSAKDATLEGKVMDKKKSIVGDGRKPEKEP